MNALGTVHSGRTTAFRPLPPSPFLAPPRGAPWGQRRSPEGGRFVLLALWSPKGGSGTSVVAAALALAFTQVIALISYAEDET